MKKNTLNAINKRLATGEKSFRIGENRYYLNDSGALLHYNNNTSATPHLDGMVEDNTLNPDRFM